MSQSEKEVNAKIVQQEHEQSDSLSIAPVGFFQSLDQEKIKKLHSQQADLCEQLASLSSLDLPEWAVPLDMENQKVKQNELLSNCSTAKEEQEKEVKAQHNKMSQTTRDSEQKREILKKQFSAFPVSPFPSIECNKMKQRIETVTEDINDKSRKIRDMVAHGEDFIRKFMSDTQEGDQ